MNQIFVVGFGKFGQLAIPKIQKRWPRARIWIIDRDPLNLARGREFPGIKVLEDGEKFLWEFQDRLQPGDWIIPAVPLHLAGDWLRRVLGREYSVRKIKPPPALGAGLPFSLYLKNDLFVSLADFECPENCPSPRGFCFRTREKRPHRLGEILAQCNSAKGPLHIIQSHQLAPGLGGYRFEDLRKLNQMTRLTAPPVYLATACPCHGVITGLTWK
ncbi:MAG: hypothetical protein HY892_01575 [Deltaproteobacteria bacterium]|nr:hypothetical protein [Deltaproteobacteria bacterium]